MDVSFCGERDGATYIAVGFHSPAVRVIFVNNAGCNMSSYVLKTTYLYIPDSQWYFGVY